MLRLVLITFVAVALAGVACGPVASSDRGAATGASVVSFRADDETMLNARLWIRDPQRLVIYLHECRDDQTAWWPTAEVGAPGDPSTLTLDLRGHGTSEGDDDDVTSMPRDVSAALAFARERGFQRVVIVGAGMGAAIGMVAAAEDRSAAVLGLSAPSEFGDIRTLEVAKRLEQRVALIATDGDLSARQSVQQFRQHAAIPASRIVMLRGSEHGGHLAAGDARRESVVAFRRLLADLWQSLPSA